MNAPDIYNVWYSLLYELSYAQKAALIEVFGSAETVYLNRKDFKGVAGISDRAAQIMNTVTLNDAVSIMRECDKGGIKILDIDDEEYPKRLKEIYYPPRVLYVRGKLPEIDRKAAVAVIGTRDASEYGIATAKEFGADISAGGGIVVTGLTAGIERAAAAGAFGEGGECVAVLGTAIKPASKDMSADIAGNGAVISEYPPHARQYRTFFRERNRISAGISVGVVVVEAPENSKTALFVNEALEQGKEIFAVPGNVNSANSAGTLKFIKDGAVMVTNGFEVLKSFESMYPVHKKQRRERAEIPSAPAVSKEKQTGVLKKDNKKAIDNEKSGCYIGITELSAGLSEEQKAVLTAVWNGKNNPDDIIYETGLNASRVLTQLTLLEIKRLIRKDPAKGIIIAK